MRKLFLILTTVVACALGLSAQTRTYHGSVVDAENNEPLIGVTVMPVGGGQGVATDIDGNFTLSVPANVKKANVSYVGYKNQTVDLQNGMKIRLYSTSSSLDEVVVVAYGTASKESLTGSVAVVGAKEIEDRPVTSVTAALEGNAPGVQVNNTVGSPGTAPAIVIRGFNTINGTTSPLYVVDGVEYTGSIADLNPADIESMSVLKDAASSALYGAKGANGVILITTKKAKSVGKVDVTLQISQGMYNYGLPFYDTENATEWMQTSFDAVVNGAVSQGGYASRQDAINYYKDTFLAMYGNSPNIFGVPNNQLFNEQGIFFGGAPTAQYTDLDWWKSISQSGHRQEYNVNAAAASEKYNIFASVNYLKENGYMIRTDFERFSGRINANFQPTTYFRFGVNLNATQSESEVNPNGADGSVADPFLVLGIAPIYPYYLHNADGDIVYGDDGQPLWNTASYLRGANPSYTMRLDKTNSSATVIDANVYGTAIIPYGFELTVRGSMHRDKTITQQYTNNKYGSALAGNGYFNYGAYDYRSHQFMQSLNWSHEYGAHHVDVLLHHENYNFWQSGSSMMNMDQMFEGIFNIQNFQTNNSTSGFIAQERSESYLGRARYNYDQKYFGEVSIRRDGSSRFAKDTRWGTFWSVGASWIITREKFMAQTLSWLDYLKLRTAYGSVGNNAAAGTYAYWSLFGFGYNYGNIYSTLIPAQIAANNIRWEATKTFDIALEGSLFNSRLNFTIGYFDKRNSDLLMGVTMPASAGSNSLSGSNVSVTNNIGTMSNRGWEISFSGDIMRTKDLTWSASIDATFLKNKLVSLPYGRDIEGSTSILTEGRSLFEFYTYKWAGVDQLNGQSLYEMNQTSHEFKDDTDGSLWAQRLKDAEDAGALVKIGDRYYSTKTTFATKEFCGSSIPTVYGSFGTALSWKGLNINILFTYGLGGKTYDSVYAGYMSVGNSPAATHRDLLKSWVEAPEGMTADSPNRIDPNGVPQLNTHKSIDNNGAGSRWLTSSDYLVFKNLNVSYDLPKRWVNPLQLQNINLGVSIDNLFTATKRKGMNPQQSWSGSQTAYYGTARVFSFQLTARF